MIEHLVLFQWQEQASDDEIEAVIEALRGLKERIPGIVELSCGENFSERSQGFQHGLVVRLKDRAALEAYFPHPEHQKIVQNLIKPILAQIISVDYEI
jgi:diphthamide synthase (EF-2-diphthine--ammonia ligase)